MKNSTKLNDVSASFLIKEEDDEIFQMLLNEKNLKDWQGSMVDYVVKNGLLLVDQTDDAHGKLFPEKEYPVFVFRFEF